MRLSSKIISVCIALFVLTTFTGESFSNDKEMTAEEYKKEVVVIQGLLKEAPENPKLHNTLGFYLYKIGEYDDAKKEYADAIKYDNTFPVPYNNLGIIALIENDYEAAESYFSDAIDLNPKYAKAVYNLGVTYFRQKRYMKAVEYYLKAKDVDEDYVKEREDMEKGDAELREALKKDPDNKVLKYLLEKSNEKKNN